MWVLVWKFCILVTFTCVFTCVYLLTDWKFPFFSYHFDIQRFTNKMVYHITWFQFKLTLCWLIYIDPLFDMNYAKYIQLGDVLVYTIYSTRKQTRIYHNIIRRYFITKKEGNRYTAIFYKDQWPNKTKILNWSVVSQHRTMYAIISKTKICINNYNWNSD